MENEELLQKELNGRNVWVLHHFWKEESIPNCVDGCFYFSLQFFTSRNHSLILSESQVCASENVGVWILGLGRFWYSLHFSPTYTNIILKHVVRIWGNQKSLTVLAGLQTGTTLGKSGNTNKTENMYHLSPRNFTFKAHSLGRLSHMYTERQKFSLLSVCKSPKLAKHKCLSIEN